MTNYRKRRRKPVNRTFEILIGVLAVLLVCCAHAGRVSPQSFFLAPFAALGFMPLLLIVLVALVVAMLWRRWWAVLEIVAAVVFTAPIISQFVPINSPDEGPPVPADTTMILDVMTYNVLGFNYIDPEINAESSTTMRLILDANPDVVLMQESLPGGLEWTEIPSLVPLVNEIKAKYPYCYFGNEGLSLMSKYPFTTQPLTESIESRSPLGYNRNNTAYLARAYDLQMPNGKQLRLVNFRLQSYHLSFGKNQSVRVSPEAKPSRIERMRRSFALREKNATTLRQAIDNSPATVIVCGDMNDITTSHVYRTIKGDDLKDAWRDAGTGYAYTYNKFGLLYRIDHIFYRGSVKALNAKRLKGGSSDHYPLVATFDIDIK